MLRRGLGGRVRQPRAPDDEHLPPGGAARVYWMTLPTPREAARRHRARRQRRDRRRRRAVGTQVRVIDTRADLHARAALPRRDAGQGRDDRPRVRRHPPQRRRLRCSRRSCSRRCRATSGTEHRSNPSIPLIALLFWRVGVSVGCDDKGAVSLRFNASMRRVGAGPAVRWRRGDPPRDPGAARRRRHARRALPPVAVGGPGRLRRRRRLLRDLGLPDHVAAAARDRAHGRSRWRRFWARRARRILPAALVVLRSARSRRVSSCPLTYWHAVLRRDRARARPTSRTGISRRPRSTTSPPTTRPRRSSTSGRCRPRSSSTSSGPCCCSALRCCAGAGAARGPAASRSVLGAVDRAPASPTRSSHGGRPRGGLLRHPDAGVGVRRRRPARAVAHSRAPGAPGTALSWPGIAAIARRAASTSATPFPGYAALLPVLGALAVIRAGAPDGRLGADARCCRCRRCSSSATSPTRSTSGTGPC